MDVKALAKSKRSHSQHHSKRPHPTQTSKAPSVSAGGAGNAKQPLGKQEREKSHQSRGSSNWDRYEEEFDSGSEDPSHDSASRTTDVIVPKSKGSDFGYLISHAKSQYQSTPYSETESFSSLDDVMYDFNQGLGSMISVRGQSILSWVGDDNFIVEDEAAASHEAPFLSLNLHALAEQLAKVDLSQRLFVEADLLPPELCTEGSKASINQESDQMQTTCKSKAATTISDELAFHGFSEEGKIADENSEVMSSDTTGSGHPVPTISNQGSKSVNQVKNDPREFGRAKQSSALELTAQSSALESTAQFHVKSVADPKKTPSAFEAAAAEAELDMLLDSFSETKFLDSSGFKKSSTTFPVLKPEISKAPPQLSRKSPDPSNIASVTANLDDSIDDLLEGTSNLINQNGASLPQEVKTVPLDIRSSPSSRSGLKSKVLDDFDSWLDTI